METEQVQRLLTFAQDWLAAREKLDAAKRDMANKQELLIEASQAMVQTVGEPASAQAATEPTVDQKYVGHWKADLNSTSCWEVLPNGKVVWWFCGQYYKSVYDFARAQQRIDNGRWVSINSTELGKPAKAKPEVAAKYIGNWVASNGMIDPMRHWIVEANGECSFWDPLIKGHRTSATISLERAKEHVDSGHWVRWEPLWPEQVNPFVGYWVNRCVARSRIKRFWEIRRNGLVTRSGTRVHGLPPEHMSFQAALEMIRANKWVALAKEYVETLRSNRDNHATSGTVGADPKLPGRP